MRKNCLLFLSGMLFLLLPSYATRVTHTYADGTQEVYYTDMDCSEVHAWVAQHPEWTDIVSCDPEVIVAPPTGGVISVNSVKVDIPVLKDFSSWTKPTGKPADGYIRRISGIKEASTGNSTSLMMGSLISAACLALGFVAGRYLKK